MEFSKEELTIIFSMLEVCITSLQMKKRKNAKDAIAIRELKALRDKINKYMEGEEKCN